jgi:hypothetical protein
LTFYIINASPRSRGKKEVVMEGKRVRQTDVAERRPRGGKAPWIAAAAAALAVIGGIAGFGLYANNYDKVFPGVSAAGEDLSGLSYEQLEEQLWREP